MRPDSRLPAERVDFQSAIVGQRRNSRALEIETRLEQSVLGEGRTRLFGRFGNSNLGQRQQLELDTDVAQDQFVFGKFRRIRSRDQQPLHRLIHRASREVSQETWTDRGSSKSRARDVPPAPARSTVT